MELERWQRLEELFHDALSFREPERRTFLRRACAGDDELCGKVEAMLACDEASVHFLESPVFDASQLLSQLAVAEEAEPSTLVGKTISHYRVLERIGEGGMGVVYKAEDTRLGRFVALKFLRSSARVSSHDTEQVDIACHVDSGRLLDRFQSEARAASALDHPNICTVYDVGEWESSPFIAMQLLTGHTMRDEIGGKALEPGRLIELGSQVADALDAAHHAGIVHRDVKPANIFITTRGDAKILDFGLAKLAASSVPTLSQGLGTRPRELTNRTEALGTAAYMSPEQVEGIDIDRRTDIFSLGIVLYEMATGHSPFKGDPPQSIFESILHGVPVSPAEVNPSIPKRLDQIIRKATARDRDKRYQTAGALRDDLQNLKQGLERGRSGTIAKLKYWRIAAVGVVLLIGTLFGYTHFRRARATPFANRGMLVLADFANSTGEPIFDDALKQALRVQIEQSPFLNVVSDHKTNQELRYMGRSTEAKLTSDVARDLCERIGGAGVLSGSISRVGGHYLVGLNAQNCVNGDSLGSEQAQADKPDNVLSALDNAATRLRIKLGESLASVRKYSAPVEEATTTSLEALQAYSLAVKMRSPQGEEAAIPFFKRAIEIDPNFAMAYARMAAAEVNLNLHGQAFAAMTKAYELRDRVSQRERFYIEAHYYDIVIGEYDKAIQIYQLWKETYPDDLTPYVNLGTLYNFLGQHQKNMELQLEVLKMDPNLSNAYSNLANAYLCLNQVDRANRILAQADARKIDNPIFWEIRYEVAFLNGDPSAMERQFAAAMSEDEEGVLALQADTEAYYGHLSKARELTQRAIDQARRTGDLESATGDEVTGALREADFGNFALARQEIEHALASRPDFRARALAALTLARTGNNARALAMARGLHREFPSNTLVNGYWIPSITAAAQSAQNPRKAIEALDPATPFELGLPQTPTNAVPYPIYVRAESFLHAGEGEKAAAEFQKILDNPGIVGNYPLGALARLGLARSYALQAQNCASSQKCGDPESLDQIRSKAIKAYDDFFSLWKGADSDIPVLRAAETESRKLKSIRSHRKAGV